MRRLRLYYFQLIIFIHIFRMGMLPIFFLFIQLLREYNHKIKYTKCSKAYKRKRIRKSFSILYAVDSRYTIIFCIYICIRNIYLYSIYLCVYKTLNHNLRCAISHCPSICQWGFCATHRAAQIKKSTCVHIKENMKNLLRLLNAHAQYHFYNAEMPAQHNIRWIKIIYYGIFQIIIIMDWAIPNKINIANTLRRTCILSRI